MHIYVQTGYFHWLFPQLSDVSTSKFCAHGILADASVKLILGSSGGVAVGAWILNTRWQEIFNHIYYESRQLTARETVALIISSDHHTTDAFAYEFCAGGKYLIFKSFWKFLLHFITSAYSKRRVSIANAAV